MRFLELCKISAHSSRSPATPRTLCIWIFSPVVSQVRLDFSCRPQLFLEFLHDVIFVLRIRYLVVIAETNAVRAVFG